MKNITILTVALLGVTISACGDKTAKMQKSIDADCTRVIAMMDQNDIDDIPKDFCTCFSKKVVTTLEPEEQVVIANIFKDAKRDDDVDNSLRDVDEGLRTKIESFPRACGLD